ncbi:MAG: DNA replication/repair protein RecF [Clostridiales bacterium]|nr:DNA replication/repair protein RecF [Clostridiales bacterium]
MYVSLLNVKDYRNAEARSVELCEGRNAFVGCNARGKTNLLEAIYFSGVGKSFRTPRDRELIKDGRERAFISVTAQKESVSDTVRTVIDRVTNKRVSINNIPITRMSELMGVCPVVLFCPDGLKIIKEAPADRRRFMDIALCQASKAYFSLLSQYNKILLSRNKLLKSGTATDNTLMPWDILLADAGSKIVKTRRGYIKKLSPVAAKKHEFLSDGAETLELNYEGENGETAEEVKAAILARLSADREADLRLKYTHAGPHKDDIAIKVNGTDVRSFGSQGQQRTAALSMKLAEMELMTEVIGTSPVLLLDDVFGELDGIRRKKLMSLLENFQSVVTATDGADMNEFGVNIINI